ncbi:MAG TPA: putative peptidoglycan glycosyltransferase FtsW [Rhizomicrobium sp.]|jgi:cell division protein FtsW|nr:putative peptidoglycan glycosyltransferase FtsW [Rhizomicrobium sp.]
MSISRADKGGFANWWFTVDKVALTTMGLLLSIGLMLAFAASPAITGGPVTAGDFHYALRQMAFAAVALSIMAGASLLTLRQVKIVAALIFAGALIGSFLVLFLGSDVLGARRELNFGFMSLQPSEFLKPGFAILAAAVLADRAPMALPKPAITLLLILPAIVILLLQPDVGQSGLLLSLWGAMLFFAGLPVYWVGLMAGASAALGGAAYVIFPHVHHRVAQYLSSTDIGYQAELALKAFAHGGFAGVGPGAGTVKYRIPDAHSDYIFAVAGEEFGLVLCAIIAALFCLLTVRILLRSANARDPFCQLAGAGLAMVTGVQAFINMGVAVSLLPAKGMTLPFISYGGSSLFSIALTMGFVLAVTRQRPKLATRAESLLGALGVHA